MPTGGCWAEAVTKMADPNIWAGAVMQKLPVNAKKTNRNGPVDQLTDGPTYIAGYRVEIYQNVS